MSRLEGKITYGKLLSFAIPMIISQVFMNINFIIDGIFVATAVGTEGLAAVNIDMPLIMIMLALAVMLGTGGSALVAKELGKGRYLIARDNFSLLLMAGFLGSAVLGGVAIAFSKPILFFLGASEAVYELCYEYALPLLVSAPFTMSGVMLDMFLVVEGRPRLAMLSSLVGGVINICLDYILLFVFDFGLMGAGIATSVGYSISALVGGVYFATAKDRTLLFTVPRLKLRVLQITVTNGMSEMVSFLSMGIITLVINNTLMRLAGHEGVAAIAIIEYIMALIGCVYMGYAEGVSPITSFNYGRKDTKSLVRILKLSGRIIGVFALTTIAVALILAEPLTGIFIPEGTAVYDLALHGLHITIAGFLFMGVNVYISSFFTALGLGTVSAVLAFADTIVFTLGLLFILPDILGVDGVFLATPLADFLSALLAVITLLYKRRIFVP